MARRARIFLVRRTRDNLSVVFARRASRVGTHGLGTLEAVSERVNRISIKNIEESEARGEDFYEIRNVSFRHWYTRNWDDDRNLIPTDIRLHYLLTVGAVMDEINKIIGFTLEEEVGDEGGSGLSTVGGTSVISYRMENVNYSLEPEAGATDVNFLLAETGDKFVSEELNSVIQRSDGTFLSVDTRSVSHGGGGSAGNPVVSGAVSGDTMTLTLDDASTVDVDVTSLVTPDGITTDSPNWYYTYANAGSGDNTAGGQLNTLTPLLNTGPWHYGLTLKRGSEFLFDHTSTSQSYWLGIWGGGSTYTNTAVGTGSYWTKSIRFAATDVVSAAGSGNATKGFDIATDYDVIQGATTFALTYDYSSSKLQLWERHIGGNAERRTLITTANDAEDGNPVTISAAYHVITADIPTFTNREHTWHIVANEGTPDDTTWFDGVEVNTVLRHGTALHPGEKMTCVSPITWAQQYFSWDYTGTATGQLSVVTKLTTSWRATSQEYLMEQAGYTINTAATRYDTSVQTVNNIGGAKISVRYHLDNSLDVFDEDNEEVLFTKDADMDGNPAHMYVGFTGGATSNMMWSDWTFEPFDGAWYYHSAGANANQKYSGETLPGGERLSWGELMYPGQEFIFQESMGGTGNTHIGVRTGDDTSWTKSVSFDGTKIREDVVTGFDIASNYASGYAVNNKWVALRYDYGDKKLKWYDINTTGVETLITTATVAEDGNAIRISCSGNNKTPDGTCQLRYYGWEYAHTPTAYPQPWGNWRLDRPTSSNTMIHLDTVLRSRRALLPGYYLRWRLPQSAPATFWGEWKSSNAASGISNVEATDAYWDHGLKLTNVERIQDEQGNGTGQIGWTLNANNSNYNATSGSGGGPAWEDPIPGNTDVQFRYHATNKIDLHDHTNNEVIATKDVDGDGSGIYISAGFGHNIIPTTGIADDFMGGGDVEIATANFAPTFTTAPSMGYDGDGILNATEMVRIDQAVPVGKRMIIYPDFWGLREDQAGIAGSGPAPTGTGWVEDDNVVIGWQKANSPHVGTNVGSSNSGWDIVMYLLLRGAGTGHVPRIAIYSPGNTTYVTRDGRATLNNLTDLYMTFDRIATNSGRVMAFPNLATARAGIGGDNTQMYSTGDVYMDGGADPLTLTSDFYLYVYGQNGNFTLPTVECTELITIPT